MSGDVKMQWVVHSYSAEASEAFVCHRFNGPASLHRDGVYEGDDLHKDGCETSRSREPHVGPKQLWVPGNAVDGPCAQSPAASMYVSCLFVWSPRTFEW